jgi:hypothetical protein
MSDVKHIHYDNIVKWASDPSQKVWWKWSTQPSGWSEWNEKVHSPSWHEDLEYYIGDVAPRPTIRIGEYDVPKPLPPEELQVGNAYYFPIVYRSEADYGCIKVSSKDERWENLHENADNALLHSMALRSLTGKGE